MDTGKYFIALIARAKECDLTLHINESYETPHDSENLFSRIEAGDFCVEAQGTSLTAARDKASIQMLEKLESLAPSSNKNTVPVDKSPTELENGMVNTKPHDRPDFGLGKDPTMRLSELQMARKQPYTTYRQLQGEIKGAELLFSIEAALDKVTAVGIASTKKEAKRRASTALLQKMGYQVPETDLLDLTAPQTSSPLFRTLREEPTSVDRSLQKQDTVTQSQNTAPSNSNRNKMPVHIGPDFGLGKDPCSRLSELQMLRREKYAVYHTLEEKVVDNNYVFTIKASLNQFTATGNGRTKKDAKKRASMALLLKMGFTVPEEELLIKKVSQKHQVTSERKSKEEQCSGETSLSQERAENLDCSEVNSQDLEASAEHSERQANDDQSLPHGSESQSKQQTPEDIEICSPETRQNNITAPEKPTEVKMPEELRDDVDESVTAEEPHVAPLSTAEPDTPTNDSDTSEDSQTGILDQGPEETSPGVLQTLVDSLKDTDNPDQSPLLWSDSETSPTLEDLSSIDFSCYQDSSSCTGHLWFDGISELFQSPEGSQISEQLQIFTSPESRWLDDLSDILQSPVEVPEGEIVEKLPETSDNSSDGHQSPSKTQSAGEQENLDENTQTTKDAKIREKTQLPENSTEQEGQEEDLTDELCKVTGTEAGEILPDKSVETDPDSSVDSETGPKIESPENSQEDLSCPKNTISDCHQILEEIFNLALNSPLWAESPEDVNEDLATENKDSVIPELSPTDDSEDNISDIYEDCPEDICSEGHQSPSETRRPEKQEIHDDSMNSESAESLVETQNETRPKDTIADGHQILEEVFNLALNSPLWGETLEHVDDDPTTEEPSEDSELKELSHRDDLVDNIFDIYEDSYESPEEPSCPEDMCSEGHQSLDKSQDPALVHDDPREDLCEKDSKLHTVPESTDAPETISDHTLESFVIWVMVKKLLKNRPAHLRSYHDMLVNLLEKAALDHFKVPEGVHLKPKNVQKLGKAAARDLMHEYGGSLEVLLAALGTKAVELQEDAMKHLNIRLNAFRNRPKSGLKRFFSKWDKLCY